MTNREARVAERPERVSVVIPAFNAERTIRRAIASALRQDDVELEVLVVDDCSSDRTVEEALAIGDTRVRVIRQERNAGVSAARNAGVHAATGTLIAFLDADDEWLPGKLRQQLLALAADPVASLVSCDSEIHRVDGSVVRHHETVSVSGGREAWKALLRGNFVPTPTVLCRRVDLIAVGGFDQSLSFAEDLDVWVRVAQRGGIVVVDRVLVRIYGQPTGLSRSQPLAERFVLLPLVERHLVAAGALLTVAERRAILGENCFNIGYRLYRSRRWASAIVPLLRAVRYGWRPLRASLFAVDCALGGPLLRARHR